MVGRLSKRLFLAGTIAYAFILGKFEPTVRDLMDYHWHMELPIRLVARRLATVLPAVYERFGEPGVAALQYLFYKAGEERALIMQEHLEIDPWDARSLGRVLDFDDCLARVVGRWTVETGGRAVKEEHYCPVSAELELCPEVCTSLLMALEAGTFSTMNPELRPPVLSKLLSLGDDCCRMELAFDRDSVGRGRYREASPHATPGDCPPVITVPGLRTRLFITCLKGVIKAVVTIILKGPMQPMAWYERFRYASDEPESLESDYQTG